MTSQVALEDAIWDIQACPTGENVLINDNSEQYNMVRCGTDESWLERVPTGERFGKSRWLDSNEVVSALYSPTLRVFDLEKRQTSRQFCFPDAKGDYFLVNE